MPAEKAGAASLTSWTVTAMVSVSSLSELPSVTLMITVQSLLSAPAPHGVSSKSTALAKVSAPLPELIEKRAASTLLASSFVETIE